MLDLIFLTLGAGVLALFAGYAVLLRRLEMGPEVGPVRPPFQDT